MSISTSNYTLLHPNSAKVTHITQPLENASVEIMGLDMSDAALVHFG